MAYVFSPEQKAVRLARAKAWNKANPERHMQNVRLYQARHKAEIAGRSKALASRYRIKIRDKLRAFRLLYPWYNAWQCARQRCVNPKHPRYHRYGGRGIRFNLSKADIAFLWTRDKASSLVCPSLDRINNDGDYSLDNCRWIERSHNSIKHDKTNRQMSVLCP